MLFNRPTDPREPPRPGLKPAPHEAPIPSNRAALASTARVTPSTGAPTPSPPASTPRPPSPAPVPAPPAEAAAPDAAEAQGSRLFIGVNIKLKGVEISDCDVLVIQGQVEATVHSKAMQIDKPGTLKGTALIDVAEIHGEFSGELTARTRLVVHGTGRVSGNIRYGKLIVAEGGEINGDVKGVDGSEAQAQRSLLPSRSAAGGRIDAAPV